MHECGQASLTECYVSSNSAQVSKRRQLAGLLARELGVRNRTNLSALTAAQVVGWAKAHHRRTGEWPTGESGSIGGVPGETWHGVDLALRWGYRGLPGGSSLGRLLREYREGPGRPAARP